ncbi:LytTR family DNA-binding domain-containing protein [Emticicia sp. W12TSBA100-4]|uniref:LytTR family DNA-binding domain-containing protein n=1 Tax=Emticicia sp. W12TSBA100-4 TaxID=3160965 RepID=UPI0033069118
MKPKRKRVEKALTSLINQPMEIHLGSRINVFTNEIVAIEASTSYSKIFMNSGKQIFVSTNIQTLEGRLMAVESLIRIHRSYIINTQYILKYTQNKIQLSNGLECQVARRRRNKLVDLPKFTINTSKFNVIL